MSNKNFIGETYRTADNWFYHVNLLEYANKPIKYLEIGTFYGANLLSVEKTYASNSESKLYCIDLWEDYDDYPDYQGRHMTIYDGFMKNIENSGKSDKIEIRRGYSHNELLKFEDEFFDIIYVDANHRPQYVLEDAVLSFRKLKKNGIMIFDDYGWGGPDMTQRGIDAFVSAYHKCIVNLGLRDSQVFIRKL